jgi:hypothetical protein
MDPKPETICKPGWEQAPFVPLGSTQTGAVCGLMPVPLIVGLFRYVRLNILTNSARRFKVTLSLIRNNRPIVHLVNLKKAGVCPEASIRPVAQPSRAVASMPTGNYIGGFLFHK